MADSCTMFQHLASVWRFWKKNSKDFCSTLVYYEVLLDLFVHIKVAKDRTMWKFRIIIHG